MKTINSFSEFGARLRELFRSGESFESFHAGSQEFDRLALELFRLQFEHNREYRRVCEALGINPQAIEHWSRIPAMPTAAFKELELTSLAADERTTVFHSSGTTEQRRSRHFHSNESLAIYEESLLAWFKGNVPGKQPMRMISLTPGPGDAPHSSLAHMFETVRRKFGSEDSAFLGKTTGEGDWVLDAEAAGRELEKICAEDQPGLVLGTAFSFVHLLDYMRERNVRIELPRGSMALETGGYKGRSRSLAKTELHSLIGDRLGIAPERIICEYGMSELSSQAYDGRLTPDREASSARSGCEGGAGLELSNPSGGRWPLRAEDGSRSGGKLTESQKGRGRVFRFPPWARAQIISPETGREVGEGETGLIRIFDLANVYSVMAIQTEDLGVKREEAFKLVGRAAMTEARGCSLMAV
jgi:hypothetical protein